MSEWAEAREERLHIDRGLCTIQLPGCWGNAGMVHHRRRSDRKACDHDVTRLLSVCGFCHDRVHSRVDWANRHNLLLRSYTEGEPFLGCDLSCEVDHRD